MSRVESAVRMIIDLNHAFNAHDLETMTELFSADIRLEDALADPHGVIYSGPPAVMGYFKNYFQKHATLSLEQEELFGFGSRCILRWKVSLEPKAVDTATFRGISLFQIRNGKIAEILTYAR